jgi:hypothetical protein
MLHFIDILQYQTKQVVWNTRSAESRVPWKTRSPHGKHGVWKTRSPHGKHGVWKTQSVENTECGKHRVLAMENTECHKNTDFSPF